MIEGKTVVIVGGAGFIGCSLAEKLVQKNKVILIDQFFDNQPLRYSEQKNHPNLVRVKADVLEYDSIAKHVGLGDIVIHLSAIVGVNKVRQDVRKTMNVNYIGTLNVVRAAEESGKCQRFVYFSTSEIFGVNSFHAKEDSPPSFGHVEEARWCYAISKLAGEHLVWSSLKENNLPATIIRPFNIFGPKRTGDYALVRFIVRALLNRPLEVHGGGSQIRSWCYIDDLCEAVRLVLARPEAVGEDFNIGNPRNTLSIYQVAWKTIQLVKAQSRIVFLHQEFRDIDVRVPYLDKAKTKLGFEPRFELDEALQMTIDWYRAHLDDFVELYG